MASSTNTPFLDTYSSRFSFARGASRGYGAMPRSKDHLDRAIAEIDGLFAGARYQDKMELTSTTSSPSCTSDDDLLQELQQLDQLSSPPSPLAPTSASPGLSRDDLDNCKVPASLDWSSIQDVRHGMESLWNRFDNVSRKLNIPAVDAMRKDFGSAVRLREVGAFAFRNMLTGPAPNDLKKIFAFVSLSYVVSKILHAKGRIPEKDILDGVHIWLDALPNEAERSAFNELAQELWPESRSYLHSYQLGMSGHQKRTIANLQTQGMRQGAPTVPGGGQPSINMWADNAANSAKPLNYGEPNIYDQSMMELPSDDMSWLMTNPTEHSVDHVLPMMRMTAEDFGWAHGRAFLDPGPSMATRTQTYDTRTQAYDNMPSFNDTGQGHRVDWTDWHNPNAPMPQETDHDKVGSTDSCCPLRHELDLTKRLQGTAIFRAVIYYLQLYGDLAYMLSAEGKTAKDSRACLEYGQDRKAKKQIHKGLLMRLSSEKRSKGLPARAILSITKLFVECGHLQSVSEAREYMMSFGELVMSGLELSRFQCWVFGIGVKTQASRSSVPCPRCRKVFGRATNMRRHYNGSCLRASER